MEFDTPDTFCFESCSSSRACDMQEVKFGVFEEDAGQG